MGFLIIPAVLIFWCAVFNWGTFAEGAQRARTRLDNVVSGVLIGTTLSVLTIGIVAMSVGLSGIGRINQFRAFHDYGLQQYDEAIDQIKQGIPVDEQGNYILGAENFAQIQAYSDAVNSRREAVVKYNASLVSHKYWQDNWFIGNLWPNVPQNIDYIEEGK